jgi:hypothetical protein
MGSRIDASRAKRGFQKLEKNPVVAEIAVAAYQKPLRDGLVERLNSANWPPNSPEWEARKRGRKQGTKPWVRTGATLEGITDNAPKKLGTKKGVKVGINWRNSRAFAAPRAFTDAKGERLPAQRQDIVFNALQRGSALSKLGENARKRGRSLADVLSEVFGPKRNAKVIPPRPLFAWSREWEPDMERDIDAAIKRAFAKEGFKVR